MGTYRNQYSKKEDETLWELHEIRNSICIKNHSLSLEEVNKNALQKYESWKLKRRQKPRSEKLKKKFYKSAEHNILKIAV